MNPDPDTVENGGDDIDLGLEDDTDESEEEVNTFIATYDDIAGKLVKDWDNLLHMTVEMVKHHTIEPQSFEILIQRLVEKYPQLLMVVCDR
ncbi:hypothetical protein ACHAQJ_010325 [Trichoderma viride]